MKIIPLSQGKFAKVDDEDYERLMLRKWHWNIRGYAISSTYINRKVGCLYMHRVIMNTPEGMQTDHINGDKLDNRKENLRVCTSAENKANKGKQSNNTAGYKGVCWQKYAKKWQAQIKANGTLRYLGLFDTAKEAARAYNEVAKEIHGEFARLNEGV